jgi:hypothetical protein
LKIHHKLDCVNFPDPGPFTGPERFEIRSEHGDHSGVPFGELSEFCTTGKRLEPKRTRSRKEVRNVGARQVWRNDTHPRLPNSVARRPNLLAWRSFDDASAPFTGDDSHEVMSRRAWTTTSAVNEVGIRRS